MSSGLCSISNTTPSYGAAAIAWTLSRSALAKVTNAALPASSAAIARFRRGISGICPLAFSARRKQISRLLGQGRVEYLVHLVRTRRQLLAGSAIVQHLHCASVRLDALRMGVFANRDPRRARTRRLSPAA